MISVPSLADGLGATNRRAAGTPAPASATTAMPAAISPQRFRESGAFTGFSAGVKSSGAEKSGVSWLEVVDDSCSNAGGPGIGAVETDAGVWIGAAVWAAVAAARGDGAGAAAGDGA